jgi:hypothetical protein
LIKLNMGLVKLNRRKLKFNRGNVKTDTEPSCEGVFKLGLWVW